VISGYVFTIDNSNGDIVELPNSGSMFNAVTIDQINKATPGRIVTIDHIKIMKEGKEMKVPSKIYSITD
jgi:hypothetical protein